MPPNVPQDRQKEYQATAEAIMTDARGTLPNGAKVQTVDAGARGQNPFRDHLQYCDEMIVLAGSSGKLTMLAESGSGTLGGNAHADTFSELAQAEAEEISETLQKQFDAVILSAKFPGQPQLAYFELAAKEETNVGEIADHAQKFGAAGYSIEVGQLSERSGYNLSERAPVDKTVQRAEAGDPTVQKPGLNVMNRRALLNASASVKPTIAPELIKAMRQKLATATAKDLAPVRARLKKILDELEALRGDSATLLKKINADPEMASAMEEIIGTSLVEGLTTPPPVTTKKAAAKSSKK